MVTDLSLESCGGFEIAVQLGKEILNAHKGRKIRPSLLWTLLNKRHYFRILVSLPTAERLDMTSSPAAQIIEAKLILAALRGLAWPVEDSPENTDDIEYQVAP